MTTFGELKCDRCETPSSERALHRANPKGQAAIWRCELCLGKPVDPAVSSITDAIEFDNLRKRG
jgi:hypothetical protein